MSNNKKTTAVEWLFNQLPDHLRSSRDGFDMLRQAKVMEEEQIIDSYYAGTLQFDNAAPITYPKTPQDYYTETYINSPAIGG